MKQLLALILAALALGGAAVGCGGDDDDSGNGGGDQATTEQTEQTATTEREAGGGGAEGGGAEAGRAVEVEVVDIDYDPKDATVDRGATVRWTNTGNLPHTVTKEGGPGPDFDSGTMQPGDTYEQTFDTAGEIAYHCTIHSGQDGTVTVR